MPTSVAAMTEETISLQPRITTAIKLIHERSDGLWRKNPIQAKVLERVKDYLVTFEELAARGNERVAPLESPIQECLSRLIDAKNTLRHLELETAWDIEADLRTLVMKATDDEHLYMYLVLEKRNMVRDLYEPWTVIWRDRFEERELDELIGQWSAITASELTRESRRERVEAWHERVKTRLEELYTAQQHEWRHGRAYSRDRGNFLFLLSLVLIALVGGLAGILDFLLRDGVVLLVAAAAGSVGGILGVIFRLRDARGRIQELVALKDLRIVQLATGAAMGLAVVLILRSGLLSIGSYTLPQADLLQHATIGLIAGFVEPLSLRLVERAAFVLGQARPVEARRRPQVRRGGNREER